jgi:8-oxo-dGTP pyrophosphatase MutT (NUDIX family)
MPIPPFIVELRRLVGTHQLWLPAVTAVVLRDAPGGAPGREVLLTRRADNGAWAPVTGILDPGEEPAVGAAREALEETGVAVSVDRLASVSVTPPVVHGGGDRAIYLDLTFACSPVSGEARVADDENLEVAWWPLDAMPPMEHWLRQRIDDAVAGETATRYRQPPS